jgi:hypothetical protein
MDPVRVEKNFADLEAQVRDALIVGVSSARSAGPRVDMRYSMQLAAWPPVATARLTRLS